MTIEPPSIEMLIEMNKHVSRRLHILEISPSWKKNPFFIADSENNKIKATPIYMPSVISVNSRYEYNPENKKPFYFSSVKPRWGGNLSWEETHLILGKDSSSGNFEEVNAMLEAASSGPGLSNAYVLGIKHSGLHAEPGYTIIGVQYYKISSKRHKQLGIEFNKKSLDYHIYRIKEERNS